MTFTGAAGMTVMAGDSACAAMPERGCPGPEAFWEHWGFVPWRLGSLAGVARLQRFVKSGLLGTVAEYRAWDYIVWQCGTAGDREELWRSLRPMPEVMTQRFLFVLEEPWPRRRIRSFWFGARGFAEFFACCPDPAVDAEPRDLTGLVRLAGRLCGQ